MPSIQQAKRAAFVQKERDLLMLAQAKITYWLWTQTK